MTFFSLSNILSEFCEFAQLVTTVVSFSALDKSRDPRDDSRILDDMYRPLKSLNGF